MFRALLLGMKTCTKCGEAKPLEAYHRNRGSRDGRQGWCKPCDIRTRRDRAMSESPTEKFCPRCSQTLPIDAFAKNKAARDGRQAYCRACSADVQREYLARNADLVALRRAQKLLEPIGADKTKVCKKCEQEKPLLEFYAHRGTRDRRATWCKLCSRDYDRARRAQGQEKYRDDLRRWREANPERRKELMRAWNLKLYGLRPEDYIALYDQQLGCCKICGETGETFGGRRLHVDHDHQTGRVRGLLCGLCNAGIGMLGDSPQRLRAAASYLEVKQE